MNLNATRERTERMRLIPLASVLLAAGALPDDKEKARWHTSKGVISVTGMKFMNWTCDVGGGGAIDLAIHILDLDFKSAIAWLDGLAPVCAPAQLTFERPAPELKLPVPVQSKLSIVENYLVNQRRINPALISQLVESGDLYADRCANAVFLLRSTHNDTVGAELRGTSHAVWRGLAPGSRKNLGYFSVRAASINGVILCESAIDTLSCLAIHPGHWCISTAGARPNPAWLPPLIAQGVRIYCGFDADSTGDSMAQAMTKLYPNIKRIRPTQHDWNDMLCASSQP
jgi:hypothetical protein